MSYKALRKEKKLIIFPCGSILDSVVAKIVNEGITSSQAHNRNASIFVFCPTLMTPWYYCA